MDCTLIWQVAGIQNLFLILFRSSYFRLVLFFLVFLGMFPFELTKILILFPLLLLINRCTSTMRSSASPSPTHCLLSLQSWSSLLTNVFLLLLLAMTRMQSRVEAELDFGHHSNIELRKYMRYVNLRYPNITKLHSIGESVEGKWSLSAILMTIRFGFLLSLSLLQVNT